VHGLNPVSSLAALVRLVVHVATARLCVADSRTGRDAGRGIRPRRSRMRRTGREGGSGTCVTSCPINRSAVRVRPGS
jgi:hypothetical protein